MRLKFDTIIDVKSLSDNETLEIIVRNGELMEYFFHSPKKSSVEIVGFAEPTGMVAIKRKALSSAFLQSADYEIRDKLVVPFGYDAANRRWVWLSRNRQRKLAEIPLVPEDHFELTRRYYKIVDRLIG